MFGYLRIFVLVSLISVVIIAVMVGFYLRSVSKYDLMSLTEDKNNLLISSYQQVVWNPHPFPAPVFRARDKAEVEKKKKIFIKESQQFLSKIGAPYFVIYDKSGQSIYSYMGEASGIRLASKMIASLLKEENKTLSILTSRQRSDESGEMMMVRTYTLLGEAEGIDYYVEVYDDVTEAYHKIILQQWVASGSIIIVFLLLMWILLQTSKRAEQIIARQHESNMDLAKKAAVAEAENEQKSMFLANVSHELRTPLNAIIGFSDLMKHQLPKETLEDKYGNYVHDIHNAGVHLLSLINDILDFTKAEAGKLEVDIEEVNLSRVVKHSMRLVSPRAEEAGVALFDMTPKDALILRTDNKKLKQVLLNLLSNAVKFTPKGGEIRVGAWRNIQDETIGFEIKDNGIGMAPKDISRAMSPFGQVDSTLSRQYEGTGLGLPLTKKFVELMGGEFKIESAEGVGTTVTINLPIEYSGIGTTRQRIA